MTIKLLITLISLATAAAYAADGPKIGSPAPDFTATDSHGKKHSLSDYKGKTVVLEWFNPGCPFVKKHYESSNMQKLQEQYAGKGVVWLSIDSSAKGLEGHLTSEEANKQIADWKIKSTALLLDEDGKVGRTYGAKNTPHMFVINPEGNLIYEGAIDSKPSTDEADIPGATNYVAAALDESLAGKPVTTASTRPYGCTVKYAK